MTLPTIDQARSWRGLTLVATDDEPVGRIEAIYVDRTTRQPEWALVHTGLFGSSRTFVPLADAAQRGDTVQVPHELTLVREAPRLDQDAELSEEDEARLYAHYGIEYTTEASASGLPGGESAPAGDATTELPPSSRLEADAPAAAGVAAGTGAGTTPAAGTSWSEGTTGAEAGDAGGPKGGRGGRAAATGGLSTAGSTRAARTAARKAVQTGQQAAASGRMAVHKASQEVSAVAAAIETTPESKRKARKRARARKRAMAAATGAARSVAAALAAAWRRIRKSDTG
jgi:PRC-barrel domain